MNQLRPVAVFFLIWMVIAILTWLAMRTFGSPPGSVTALVGAVLAGVPLIWRFLRNRRRDGR